MQVDQGQPGQAPTAYFRAAGGDHDAQAAMADLIFVQGSSGGDWTWRTGFPGFTFVTVPLLAARPTQQKARPFVTGPLAVVGIS